MRETMRCGWPPCYPTGCWLCTYMYSLLVLCDLLCTWIHHELIVGISKVSRMEDGVTLCFSPDTRQSHPHAPFFSLGTIPPSTLRTTQITTQFSKSQKIFRKISQKSYVKLVSVAHGYIFMLHYAHPVIGALTADMNTNTLVPFIEENIPLP